MMEYSGISIYYVESDGVTWAGYFHNKLASKEYDIESKLNAFSENMSSHFKSSKLNLFFISPDFLDIPNWDILKTFNKETSMAVLTGIDYADIDIVAKMRNCRHVLEWNMNFQLEESENSVRDLLILTISVYEGENAMSATDRCSSPLFQHPASCGTSYDKLPADKPRQVNTVQQVFHRDDKVYVLLERPAEDIVGIQLRDNSQITSLTDRTTVYVFGYKDAMKDPFNVTMGKDIIGEASISSVTNTVTGVDVHTESPIKIHAVVTRTDNRPVPSPRLSIRRSMSLNLNTDDKSPVNNSKEIFPETAASNVESKERTKLGSTDQSRLQIPDNSEKVSRDKSNLDQIRELLEAETDPEQMLCRCLGIDKDVRRLDEKMKSMVACSETLKHLSFRASSDTCQDEDTEPSAWPTLLHLGAQYNLMNFCDALLNNPLMHDACIRPNKEGQLPHDLARQHGHLELAEMLKHFCDYVKAGKEGKYDSGFAGSPTGAPRLSTILQTELSQSRQEEEQSHTKLTTDLKKKPSNLVLADIGLGRSIDEEDINTPASDIKSVKSTQQITTSVIMRSSSSPTLPSDDPFDDYKQTPKHKNLNKVFGADPPPSPVIGKKKFGPFGSLKKKHKEQQDSDDPSSSKNKHTSGMYTKHSSSTSKLSGRSCEGSSRQSSRVSDVSTSSRVSDLRDEEDVHFRGVKKTKNKSTIFSFMKNAKNRKSKRITAALEATHLSVPSLPPRRKDSLLPPML